MILCEPNAHIVIILKPQMVETDSWMLYHKTAKSHSRRTF